MTACEAADREAIRLQINMVAKWWVAARLRSTEALAAQQEPPGVALQEPTKLASAKPKYRHKLKRGPEWDI